MKMKKKDKINRADHEKTEKNETKPNKIEAIGITGRS